MTRYGFVRQTSLLVLTASLMMLGCSGSQSDRGRGEENIQALTLAELINQNRTNNMTWDAGIAAVEQAHATWLSQQPPAAYMYPYYEEGDGGKLFPERLTDAGITDYAEAKEYGFAGETLSTAEQVWALLESTDITDTKWDRFGIGFVSPPYREAGQRYWVIGVVNSQ